MKPRVLLVALTVGLLSLNSWARLPAAPVDPVKAEETKQKAADAAKKEAELLAKAQDRAAAHYQKTKGGKAGAEQKTSARK
jgi:hypothetical protein